MTETLRTHESRSSHTARRERSPGVIPTHFEAYRRGGCYSEYRLYQTPTEDYEVYVEIRE